MNWINWPVLLTWLHAHEALPPLAAAQTAESLSGGLATVGPNIRPASTQEPADNDPGQSHARSGYGATAANQSFLDQLDGTIADTGHRCGYCGTHLGPASPSDLFCCEGHQESWHAARFGRLPDASHRNASPPVASWLTPAELHRALLSDLPRGQPRGRANYTFQPPRPAGYVDDHDWTDDDQQR